MKTLFIPLIKKEKLNKEKLSLNEIPDTIYIVYSIQYKKIAEEIKDYLSKSKKKISGFSQVLGCSDLKSKLPILLISDGGFHSLNLLEQGNEVYLFDNNSLKKLEKKDLSKQLKSKLNNFYNAKKLGILISIKKGQYNLDKAIEIKEKLKSEKETKSKKPYLFLADNINISEFENFDIDFFINTACSGLAKDSSKIINYKSLKL